jgi:hypothetical protein
MLPGGRLLRALFPIALLISCAGVFHAQARAASPKAPTGVHELGKGTIPLDGPWRFHLGDNPAWSAPNFDDSLWEQISADLPWGMQGHFAYAGFAWYRLHLAVTPAPDVKPGFLLLMPRVTDAYQVYWNGALIGQYGKLPPHASWPAFPNSHIFGLPAGPSGTLAIRVWSAPLGSDASGQAGGLTDAPIIGYPGSVTATLASREFDSLRFGLYVVGLSFLRFLIGCVALAMWLRRRSERFLLWFAIFTAGPALWNIVYSFGIPIPAFTFEVLNQPLWALENVALWFLLLSLLRLESHTTFVRWVRVMAICKLAADALDGLVILCYPLAGWTTYAPMLWTDGVLTVIGTIFGVVPLVIVAAGLRRKLDPARWAVAITALVSQMNAVVISGSQQGERFTHWTLGGILSRPLFFVHGMYFNTQILADTALFLSVVYAVYRFSVENRRRQAVLEQEFQNARELQQLLIPETSPEIPGFTLTSAYKPALEVGGDFFQIVPLERKSAGAILVVLGDVSGKGLKAAMAVSLIVGAIRTLAETTSSPAEILAGIGRRLYGRLQGGFTTCVALRLDPDGQCTLAAAGHLPPFLNDQEVDLPGALPLGVAPSASYEERSISLGTDDRLTLYTDGLLEARNQTGELYGFERLKALFATAPTAAEATEAAVGFGQDDDITVLTLTRLAPGEESTAQYTAPILSLV